jgi:hypothetical protein
MNQKLRFFIYALPALAGFADAQIDSGGGRAAVGSLTNHSAAVPLASSPSTLNLLS